MSIATTFALAVVPSLLLVRYFHDRDLYPEPPRLIWTTFALGALTTIPVLLVTLPFFGLLQKTENPYSFGLVSAFVFAAIPEEFFKLTVLLGFSMRRSEFDEPMDGIVYGAVVGQGFAALENVIYSVSGGSALAIMRAFTAVPAHACMGIIMGYYIGRARFEPERRFQLIGQGYLFAVLMHGLYDFPMMINNALVQWYGEIPDEYLNVALACLASSAAVLVLSIVLALRLVRIVHRDQVAHSQPPALPGAILAQSDSPPALPTMTREPAPADVNARRPSTGLPPPIPQHVPLREASPDMLKAFLMMVCGLVFAVFGGVMASSGVQALQDSRIPTGSLSTMLLALILLGFMPLGAGVRMFRKGVRDLNAAHRKKAVPTP